MLLTIAFFSLFFFSSRRRHTRLVSDWSSDVCSSDLGLFSALHLLARAQAGNAQERELGQEGEEPKTGHRHRPVRSTPRRRESTVEEILLEEIELEEVQREEVVIEEVVDEEIVIPQVQLEEEVTPTPTINEKRSTNERHRPRMLGGGAGKPGVSRGPGRDRRQPRRRSSPAAGLRASPSDAAPGTTDPADFPRASPPASAGGCRPSPPPCARPAGRADRPRPRVRGRRWIGWARPPSGPSRSD